MGGLRISEDLQTDEADPDRQFYRSAGVAMVTMHVAVVT